MDDYGEQAMSQDIPFDYSQPSSFSLFSSTPVIPKLQTPNDKSNPSTPQDFLSPSNNKQKGAKSVDPENESFYDSIVSLLTGFAKMEPFVDILIGYILLTFVLPREVWEGGATDFVVYALYVLYSVALGIYRGTALVHLNGLYVFAGFYVGACVVSSVIEWRVLVALTFCLMYFHIGWVTRGLKITTFLLITLLLILDMKVRAGFYDQCKSLASLGLVVQVLCFSLYNILALAIENILRLRDYRALVSHLDHVYGDLSLNYDFLQFLHYPVVASNLKIQEKPLDKTWRSSFKKTLEKLVIGRELPNFKYAPELGIPMPDNVLSFSNTDRKNDRLEICIEKVESETVWISWSTPRSLLIALVMNPVKETGTAQNNANIFDSDFPKAFLKSSIAESKEGSTVTRHSFTEVEGEFAALSSDVALTLNGKSCDNFDVHLPKKIVRLTGLKPGTEYSLILTISGYSSVPLNVLTPVKEVLPTVITPDQEHFQKNLTKRAELIYAVDDEKAKKKDYVSHLKKIRKDHPKNVAAVKTELDQLKRTLSKDEAFQLKTVARMQNLTEIIKTVEKTVESMKRDIDSFTDLKAKISQEFKAVDEEWKQERVLLEETENSLKTHQSANEDVIRKVSEELSELTHRAGDQQEKLVALDKETRGVEDVVADLEESIKTEKKKLSQIEKNIKEENKQLERISSEWESRAKLLQDDVLKMEKERLQLTLQLERDRSQVMVLDTQLMRKREQI